MKFTGCGSLNGEFSVLLPPGRYEVQVYCEGPDGIVSPEDADSDALLGDLCFEVIGSQSELNLGTFDLVSKAP